MTGCLFWRDGAIVNQCLNKRLVMGHLTNPLRRNQIGAAVADVDNMDSLAHHDGHHQGAAHMRAVLLCGVMHDPIRHGDGIF